MESISINVFWPQPMEPIIGLKIKGCKGKEELKRVILVIEESWEKNFPGIPVTRRPGANEIFEEGG